MDERHIEELSKKRARLVNLEWAKAHPAERGQVRQMLEQQLQGMSEHTDLAETPVESLSTMNLIAVFVYQSLDDPEQRAAVCKELDRRLSQLPPDHPVRAPFERLAASGRS